MAKTAIFNLAGAKFHQPELAQTKSTTPIHLVREPENPHDKNAVAIKGPDEVLLGYVPRDFAQSLSELIDETGIIPSAEIYRRSTFTADKKAFIGLEIQITLPAQEE